MTETATVLHAPCVVAGPELLTVLYLRPLSSLLLTSYLSWILGTKKSLMAEDCLSDRMKIFEAGIATEFGEGCVTERSKEDPCAQHTKVVLVSRRVGTAMDVSDTPERDHSRDQSWVSIAMGGWVQGLVGINVLRPVAVVSELLVTGLVDAAAILLDGDVLAFNTLTVIIWGILAASSRYI